MGSITTRFAPSTTGNAHPGTLLSALLTWLDSQRQQGRIVLRLEDIDPQRCKPHFAESLILDLSWLGFLWDTFEYQSQFSRNHDRALRTLAEQGRLYQCSCTRSQISARSHRAPDGGVAYDNRCRENLVSAEHLHNYQETSLRCRLDDSEIEIRDESGLDLTQNPSRAFGDPVVRRRDGSVSYNLAVVVDDGERGINRVIRGKDLASATATHVALQRLLGYPTPIYRHHLLLLEEQPKSTRKLAKFHKAVGTNVLRQHYGPGELLYLLAGFAGIDTSKVEDPKLLKPKDLVDVFDWRQVRGTDLLVVWDAENATLRAG